MNITYAEIKNPRWANVEKTQIICEVNFDHVPEDFVPFLADPNDIYAHAKEIFERCVAGDFGVVGNYQSPENEIPVVDVSI